MLSRKILRATALFIALPLAALFAPWQADAASYPQRPVTIVTAFTPGGPSDILARVVGNKLADILGQPFVIEGRPGGGGNIAAEYVAHAEPDGYTLLLGNNSILATNLTLYKKLGYDPQKDFAPLSLIGTQTNILVPSPKLNVTSLAQLIGDAKASPGKLNVASTGYGAAAHMAAELFMKEAQVRLVIVPYKGAAPAIQDLVGGQVDLIFATSASVMGQIGSGTLKPLAVTTLQRTPLLPDVPTLDELGLKGFEATTWHGLVAPARTPPDIVAALNRAINEALKDKAVVKSLSDLGVDIAGSTPEAFDAYIRAEIPKWAATIKASGAQVE